MPTLKVGMYFVQTRSRHAVDSVHHSALVLAPSSRGGDTWFATCRPLGSAWHPTICASHGWNIREMDAQRLGAEFIPG